MTAGQKVYIRISGFSGAAGAWNLFITTPAGHVDVCSSTCCTPADGTDSCTATPNFACAGHVLTGSTAGHAIGGTAPCGTSNSSPVTWLRFRSPLSGFATFSLAGSDYDTVLSLHASQCDTSALACNDDATESVLYSRISDFLVTANETVRVV